MFPGVYWNQPVFLFVRVSVRPSVRVSIRVQNTCVCQSAGKGINSLPYMATLGSSNITANKDMMDK